MALASSATASLPADSRSAMIPEPTTVASSSAVPMPSAIRRRCKMSLIAAACAGFRRLLGLRDLTWAAAAGRQPAADLGERGQHPAAAIDRRFTVGEEGFPRHALRVSDPLLVRLRIATGRSLLLDGWALGAAQPFIDLSQFAFVLCLDPEMRDAGGLP